MGLDPWMEQASEFMLLVLAVMVTAWYGGFRPGLLATFIGAVAGDYFLIEPAGQFSYTADDLSRVGLFFLAGAQISWLSGALHDARRRAEAEARVARESEERYRTLAANFPNGVVCLFDRDLRWVLADGTGLAAVGVSGKDLLGRTARDVLPPAIADAVERLYRVALAGGAATGEIQASGRTGLVQAVPLKNSRGDIYAGLSIALDVTETVRAREELRQARDELEERVRARTAELDYRKTLLESQSEASNDGILVVSQERRVAYFNRRFVELWQIPAPQPMALLDVVVRAMRSKLALRTDPLAEASGPYPCTRDGPPQELHLADNRVFECYSAAVHSGDGTSYGRVWFFRDVTQQKRLECQVLDVCEREQRRMGQDLHDGLGQLLTGVGLMSKALEQRLSAVAPEEARQAGGVADLIQQAVTQARDLSRGLRPVALEPDALERSLEELAQFEQRLTGVTCVVRVSPGVVVESEATATHLYRIAQEAVNNAVKHSRTDQIIVRLVPSDGTLQLLVEDQGVGVPAELPRGGGMGLQIMQYRARMIGAALEVRRRPGGGTVVACSMRMSSGGRREYASNAHASRG